MRDISTSSLGLPTEYIVLAAKLEARAEILVVDLTGRLGILNILGAIEILICSGEIS